MELSRTNLRWQAQLAVWRSRKVTGRFGPRGLILLYHRVEQLDLDPWGLAVTPTHFEEHMQVLRERYAPVHLRGLRSAMAERPSARLPIAITFDDGYADNVINALPVIERHETPATFFIVPTAVDSTTEFWWDELEHLAFDCDELPPRLSARLGDRTVSWDVPQGELEPQPASNWRGWEPTTEPRQALYQDMWRTLQAAQPDERAAALATLWDWRPERPTPRPSHRAVTSAELGRLATSKLVEIGAHTLSHVRLSSISAGEQRLEIVGSKRQLEERLGRRVALFSYPHGGHDDFTDTTSRIVRAAGFRLACAAYAGITRRWTDRYRLPRLAVSDWDGDEFARRLRGWLPE